MNKSYVEKIAGELKVAPRQVAATAALLGEGATVPFIARYRKEATGSLDEVAVTADPRPPRAARRARRAARGHPRVAPGARAADRRAGRRRRGGRDDDGARGPLPALPPEAPHARHHRAEKPASSRWPTSSSAARRPSIRPAEAAAFVSAEKGVPDVDAALAGARDILAERVSDDAGARAALRQLYWAQGEVRSVVVPGKEEEGAKFKDYFDWTEPVAADPEPPHAGDAPRRGRGRSCACASRRPRTAALAHPRAPVRHGARRRRAASRCAWPRTTATSACSARRSRARCGSSRRRRPTTRRSASSPTTCASCCSPRRSARRRVLAIDPGLPHRLQGRRASTRRASCCTTTSSTRRPRRAAQVKSRRATSCGRSSQRFQIEAIAIGNGTASRETEQFVRGLGLPAVDRHRRRSTRAARRSTRRARWRARSSPTRTSPCAARSPSAGG